ncbi:MAG: Gfo/Idh/MocA family oxidoreductase [Planctomycetes bacterium]|nr:Gfo/Idh/MocA family oxidoreductase [Planctomycetota bacterium]
MAEDSRTLGVGVLGFGFMGRTHTYAHAAIPFYYDPQPVQVKLCAVCDAVEETARRAKVIGGFERWATDPLDVINADDVDIVHVSTPNQFHFEALEAAIAAGKHIYCDKPVTGNLQEADKLEALLEGYTGKAQVALQYRWFPATLRAKQLIEEGFVGPVTHFRAVYLHGGSIDPDKAVNWKSTAAAGGGAIRDLGSHVIDLLWWLIGPFARVNTTSRIWSAERPDADHPGQRMTIDVEEGAVMTFQAADGAFGTIEASKIATGTQDEMRFEIHGRYGALRFNVMQPNYLEVFDARLPGGDYGGQSGWQTIDCVQKYPAEGGKFPGPKFTVGWIRSHVHSLYAFLKAIAQDRTPSPSLREGLHLQRVLETARDSAETGDWKELPQE